MTYAHHGCATRAKKHEVDCPSLNSLASREQWSEERAILGDSNTCPVSAEFNAS
jgi:hypothetical protein